MNYEFQDGNEENDVGYDDRLVSSSYYYSKNIKDWFADSGITTSELFALATKPQAVKDDYENFLDEHEDIKDECWLETTRLTKTSMADVQKAARHSILESIEVTNFSASEAQALLDKFCPSDRPTLTGAMKLIDADPTFWYALPDKVRNSAEVVVAVMKAELKNNSHPDQLLCLPEQKFNDLEFVKQIASVSNFSKSYIPKETLAHAVAHSTDEPLLEAIDRHQAVQQMYALLRPATPQATQTKHRLQ